MDYIFQILLPVVTGVVGWLGAKIKTRRENKQTDLQIINEAIAPLLKSIKELTDHNLTITGKLVDEQKKTLALMKENSALIAERGDLIGQIEKLNRRVASLEKLIRKSVAIPSEHE